jgi:hypothetical protein
MSSNSGFNAPLLIRGAARLNHCAIGSGRKKARRSSRVHYTSSRFCRVSVWPAASSNSRWRALLHGIYAIDL